MGDDRDGTENNGNVIKSRLTVNLALEGRNKRPSPKLRTHDSRHKGKKDSVTSRLRVMSLKE